MQQQDDPAPWALSKLALMWAGNWLGSITLQTIVLGLTGVYTGLQLYVLVRDRIWRRRGPRQ